MTNKKVEAVVFDMDGVIYDSERATLICWTEVCEKNGRPDAIDCYNDCIGVTSAKTKEIVLNACGANFPYDQFESEMLDLYHAKYSGGRLPMKPGVFELLDYLRDSGVKIALASSTRTSIVTAQLRDSGILDYFDKVVCGDMVSRSKPAPDIFLKACEELEASPADTFAIEDSYNGIKSAAAGGLRPIMVPDMLPPTEEIRALAEVVLVDLYAVVDYLHAQ